MTSGDTTAAVNHAVAKAAMNPAAETVCVTGATGFIASWLVLRLLERGYTVRATVRDPGNEKKVKHLADLPHAKTRLTLWKADMAKKGSYDEAIRGCTGVFHVASPMFLISDDPENEMIKPTVEGVLDIMRSCVESGTVRRLVITSSAGTVNQEEIPRRVYDESCWTDVQYCRDKKMIGWIYFVSKTLAEKAAWEFAKQQTSLELVTIIPTIVLGPLLPPDMPSSFTAALSPITRNEEHYGIMRQAHLVHLDDLCMAHIFLYEHPQAAGRYICSSHDVTILQVADLLRHKYPYYHIPHQFEGVDEKTEVVSFSSKKLKDLGFEFKYSLEDMYSGAVQTYQDKGLLPRPHQS